MKVRNKLGLVFFPAYDWEISKTHPERQERLLYTQDQIFEEGIEDIPGINFINPSIASIKDVERVHFAVPNVEARLTKSHLVSIGGAIKAFESVIKGEVDKSFALVRPPGHHAHKVIYGDRGFCIANLEAVALEYIRTKYKDLRVAIIDTDCHHGDGTEDIYWNDKNTLFISMHQDGRTLYPGTGAVEDFGGPGGFGYNINIPLPPGTGEEGFLYVVDKLILPILEDYKPDLIINSAGQDNHYTDPLTNMNFTAQGYAILNDKLNPDIAVLEGGYSIEGALPYINLGIILAMSGLDYSKVYEPDYFKRDLTQSFEITNYIEDLVEVIWKLWQQKEELYNKKFKNKYWDKRSRNIYYDTDGIMEKQEQKFKVCANCTGLRIIKSTSDKGDKIFAITIPRDSCDVCYEEAYDIYADIKTSNKLYTNIYMQNLPKDKFLSI